MFQRAVTVQGVTKLIVMLLTDTALCSILVIEGSLCLFLFHRPDQKVFGRMFHINKLQDLDLIPHLLQQFRPQSIRQKRSKTFLEYPILQHRRQ